MEDPSVVAKLDLLIELTRGLDARLRAVELEVAELKGEMRGEMRQMSARISDLYGRLPVPIAYSPPEPRRTGTG
ncbi:MAG: hypothetical protein WCF85_16850 [Rhodospirillaceae bacterium]